MNRLIIMRHGKAERSSPGGDFERGLTTRGASDATLMGRVLAEAGLVPDLALVSSARRTRETWAAASTAFPPARCLLLRPLYHATAEVVLAEVEAQGEAVGTVMVVGHNPGLHDLTIGLLRQGGAGEAVVARANARFPTATVSAFLFDEAGRPCYDGLFYAAEHGGGGGE